MTDQPPGIRRVCLVVDVEGYSRHRNPGQIEIQRRLLITLRRTCADANISLARSGRQDTGDGQLIVLPPGIDEARVLPGLVNGLNEALYDANVRPAGSGRLRFRAALSQGVVHVAAAGFAGDAVINACRLLDSRVLHDALSEHQESDLALIVTDDLFTDVVAGGYPGLPPDDFRSVVVAIPEKHFRAQAWILVPGRPPHAVGRRSRFDDPLPPETDFGTIFRMGTAAVGGAAGALAAAEMFHLLHQPAGHDESGGHPGAHGSAGESGGDHGHSGHAHGDYHHGARGLSGYEPADDLIPGHPAYDSGDAGPQGDGYGYGTDGYGYGSEGHGY